MKQRYRFDIRRMSADCEANYARLCRLLPELAQCGTLADDGKVPECRLQVAQRVASPAELHLATIERTRYTTTLAVEWSQAGARGQGASPASGLFDIALVVRMYHDLRLAEVISARGQRIGLASYQYPNEHMLQPDEKIQQNQFLAELLSQGVQHGLAEPVATGSPVPRVVAGARARHDIEGAVALPRGRLA